jgi:mannose-1-phosphate guanylyltransferase
LIFNPRQLKNVLKAGFDICKDQKCGVIYGMWPTRAETGFGYIQIGKKIGESGEVPYHQVISFKEKPDLATAEKYLASGEFLWNGGIFVWQISRLVSEIKEHLPELYQGLERFSPCIGNTAEMDRLAEIYPTIPAISVDYGILEKTSRIIVIPVEDGWDDLGSWSAFERLLGKDQLGNVIQGEFIGADTCNCIIYSPQKTVAAIGVSDLIIVETDDVLMVCAKDQAQNLKALLQEINKAGRQDLL